MLEAKFKCCNIGEPLYDKNVFNINDLKTSIITAFDRYLQYLGWTDANKKEIYEGDVLELAITPELMDIKQDGFSNSNLGNRIKELGDVTSVLLVFRVDAKFMSTPYDLYFCRNGKLERNEDNEPDAEACGHDFSFPQYLCNKGAIIVANIVANPTYLDNR